MTLEPSTVGGGGDPEPGPPRPIEPLAPLPGDPVRRPPDLPPMEPDPPLPIDDPIPVPPMPPTRRASPLFSAAMLLLLGAVQPVVAQVVTPPVKPDQSIVVNPTIDECKNGWEAASAKWSKEQFDQFCAVLQSPATILINPTLEECSQGWTNNARWTKQQFEGFCATLQRSK